ncbi:MAG TPA: hypothetical protein VIY48_02355 [Candidatus Paceibacterota bacterium]
MISVYPDIETNYALNVSRGRISGAEAFTAYGEKTTTGADSGVLWPNGAFVFPAAAGVQMSVVSTSANDTAAGTGIRTIDIHYLDANLAPMTETVTMNGTTPVLTVATNIRFIQCMHMATFGSGKSAAGNITASNGGNTHSYVATGDVRCSSSVRMVPAGKRLIVADIFGGATDATSSANAIIRAATPTFDMHDFTSSSIFVPTAAAAFQNGSAGLKLLCPITFTAGQSFGLTFNVDKAATVVGSWFGWLENA